MIRLLLIFLFTFSSFGILFPQNGNLINDLYVHYNKKLLTVGEMFYYKVYCINSMTNQLDKNQKIVYVELVSENLEDVFFQKISLQGGVGQGDYFFPVNISSGTYKLIAYLPGDHENILFDDDLFIVNPYTWPFKKGEITKKNTTLVLEKEKANTPTGVLQLQLSKEILGKREGFRVILRSTDGNKANGKYSLSVRKKMDLYTNGSASEKSLPIRMTNEKKRSKLTPHHSGEKISGEVVRKKDNLPIEGVAVALSVGGKNFVFSVATTNTEGKFEFWIEGVPMNREVVLQVLENNSEEYVLKLLPRDTVDYTKLTFSTFEWDQAMNIMIAEQAIYNQIQATYSEVFQNEILPVIEAPSFVHYANKEIYHLKDYTQFSSIGDVILEYVKNVWVSKDQQSKQAIIKVGESQFSTPTSLPSLLFVNGILWKDTNAFLYLDASNYKTLKVIRNKYYFEGHDYQGVLVLESFVGDVPKLNVSSGTQYLELQPISPKKQYLTIQYSAKDNSMKNIPDYRTQLLWEPAINMNSNIKQLECFTSDVPGTFEVVLQGITEEGVPIKLVSEIQVE